MADSTETKPTQEKKAVGVGKGAKIGNLLGLGAGLYYAHTKKSGVGGIADTTILKKKV